MIVIKTSSLTSKQKAIKHVIKKLTLFYTRSENLSSAIVIESVQKCLGAEMLKITDVFHSQKPHKMVIKFVKSLSLHSRL
jgi:hypothetical protein